MTNFWRRLAATAGVNFFNSLPQKFYAKDKLLTELPLG